MEYFRWRLNNYAQNVITVAENKIKISQLGVGIREPGL